MTTSAVGQNIDLVYLFSDGQIPVTFQAYRALLNEHPELRDRVTLQFITESVFDDVNVADVLAADILVFDIMNEQMLQRFNTAHDVDLIATIGENGHVFAVGEGLLPEAHYTDQGAIWDARTRAFWRYSGAGNHLGLMKAVLQESGVDGLAVPEPQVSLDFAYYYPDGGNGRLFGNWEDFDVWRRQENKVSPGAPRVAIGFYKANYYGGDMAVLDALVAEIERQGAEAIPFFGYPGATAFARMLIDENGDPRADVALSFLFRFADFQSARTLEMLDIPVLNLITLYGRSEAQWRSSSTGLSIFEGTFQVAVPELAGLTAPAVVGSRETVIDPGSGLAVVRTKAIASRLPVTVRRALKYAALRTRDNNDKHIALVYYNYPPGKAGIGASYLNVADSLENILRRLKSDGYDLGDDSTEVDLDSESILKRITVEARNVGSYAPGELDTMLGASDPVRIGMQDYTRWLDALAPSLKTRIVADWGAPANSDLMTAPNADGSKSLIVPLVRFGNVIVLPQPVRGWGEDKEKLYHAKDLSPHHQYVATYAWLRNEFAADAVVHIGTHGTLEWLDGKDVGQSGSDASDALISDMPHLYIYNVDVVGEGLVARRRGLATLVDHMVPPFTTAGLYADLAILSELISNYQSNLSKNADLAAVYAAQIREQVLRLGIAKDLDLDPSRVAREENFDDLLHEIEDYVLDLKGQNIPFGLHAFGRLPDDEARRSTAEAIAAIDRSKLPQESAVMADDMENRIVLSASREMDSLLAGLNGSFVPTGSGGEPLRNPDAYPTGKNFYGIDPDKVPKPAAWELGVALAEQMLAQHVDDHGQYPEKVSFVIWGDETMRHEGILESQIFYLLGTRPVWNERGKLVDVDIIPRSELKRPRIDIVIASAAEGMFNNVTLLMDKAVQKVKSLDEDENYVREHYLAAREKLIDLGYTEEDADRRAGVRIFDEPPGTYNLNTSKIVEASGSWSSDQAIGDDYLRKMGHGFGNGFWGEPMPDAFRLALSGTDKVVHSSSTMLYGALDNDDFYMYMGGLSSAIRNLDGANPDLVVTNTRDPGNPKMSSINEFIGSEMRSRYLNPKWIKGMQEEGYAGALEMRAFVENLWGWDATVSSTVDDAMWQEAFSTYVQDKHELNMQKFFDGNSPFAFQDISARMMETIRKGYWKTDAATLTTLMDRYISSVNDNGIGCSENTCGNPLLMQYVINNATASGIPEPTVRKFRDALESATRDTVENQARAADAFIRQNENHVAAGPVAGPSSITTPTLESQELRQYLAKENNPV
ncbi:MAG: cobaltochelatase subunit CobN, partial [Gammaproteobacteria bacterium]|nr:cobaltochelatase subunit CobN [Gammaproteobacteria bacterium]